MEPEIKLINVGKTFLHEDNETVSVLNGIHAQVTKGTIVTIVGPSGSGKSTILSLINLLKTPDEGEIYVEGKEVRDWNIQDLRRTVGIAFQNATMLKGTVLDNLSLAARLQGKTLENPKRYLEIVGLPEAIVSREAKELSGGQKQRLSLARTIVNDTSVLLLDEITSALDTLASHEVEELILRINRERNTTILWVTHDLAQAERVGNQTWLIIDGKMIESAPTKQFFNEPKEELTKQFLNVKRIAE